MPVAPVDENGTVIHYEDTGAPKDSKNYLTVVLLHGLLFHSGEKSLFNPCDVVDASIHSHILSSRALRGEVQPALRLHRLPRLLSIRLCAKQLLHLAALVFILCVYLILSGC